MGTFFRFFARGEFFAGFSYVSTTNRLRTPSGDSMEVNKPRARSEFGVRFPFTRRSTFNFIGGVTGGRKAVAEGGSVAGSVASLLTFDAVVAAKTGEFFAVFGVTNLFDRRDNDPLLDSDGRHFNPGRNLFFALSRRF